MLPLEPPFVWAASTVSPAPAQVDETVLAHCGGPAEAGLTAVAQRSLARKLRGEAALDLDGLVFAQRAAGEPHVWPRAIVLWAPPADRDALLARVDAWRGAPPLAGAGQRRCGVATARGPNGEDFVSIVSVDALADLVTPLPTRAHAGQWLTIDARLLVAATGARIVVQGPGSTPRSVPTSFDARTRTIRARFAPDRPGAFSVQVLADVGTGPRPVLEARVFADAEPPADMPSQAAPGEAAGANAPTATDALMAMIGDARAENGLGALRRDARLDAVALAHAKKMLEKGTLGHDVGDGDPTQRLERANLIARINGENVARAESASLAHRALWASPSHRANLLKRDFDRVGLAALPDPSGDGIWVVELFAGGLR